MHGMKEWLGCVLHERCSADLDVERCEWQRGEHTNQRSGLNKSSEVGKCWVSMTKHGGWSCLPCHVHEGQR